MLLDGRIPGRRAANRGDLLRQYVQLQRALVQSDPGSSAYQAAIHAFRRMGHQLITAGLEDDLDRLLRLRVLEGGRPRRSAGKRRPMPELCILERRPV